MLPVMDSTSTWAMMTVSQHAATGQGLNPYIHGRLLPQPARAFELAMRSPQRSVFIGGSLYLAGAAIEYFDAQRKRSNKKQK